MIYKFVHYKLCKTDKIYCTSDPCFLYDADSPLNDIKPSPYARDGAFGTKDIYECQKLCQTVYECNFFVYDTRLFSKKCLTEHYNG